MSFGGFPSPGKPAPIGNPKMVNPGAGALRPGPAPLPPRMMQPPRPPAPPVPRPMPQPPMPNIMPKLPYGGPIAMPGRPMPPGVQIGGGPAPLPGMPPGGVDPGFNAPIPGMPTPGMPGGKSAPSPDDFNRIFGNNDAGGYNTGGPQMIGGAYGQPIYGGQPSPMPPSMYSQPQPNFANALGTSSPFLNSVQR